MKDTPSQKAGQAGPVENTRPLPYAQVPLCLGRLAIGELDAAIRVWIVLHSWMRLGATQERVSDEDLLATPYLSGLSAEHARKGLEILERLKLINRCARGSRREVAVVAKLAGAPKPVQKGRQNRINPSPSPAPTGNDVSVPQDEWAKALRLLVSGD